MASIAIPAYYQYTKRAQFSEVVVAASSIKGLVDLCFQTRGDYSLSNCDTLTKVGGNSLDVTAGSYVDSITMLAGDEGGFTMTGSNVVDSVNYTLTPAPSASGGSITWQSSGSCVTAGIC